MASNFEDQTLLSFINTTNGTHGSSTNMEKAEIMYHDAYDKIESVFNDYKDKYSIVRRDDKENEAVGFLVNKKTSLEWHLCSLTNCLIKQSENQE